MKQQRASKEMITEQSTNAGNSIGQLYSEANFTDKNGSITGLDIAAIAGAIKKQEALLAKGDLTSLENMLHGQAHTLNAIFTTMSIKMSGAEYVKQIETFARIALKAQNQTRQTIATLAEVKGVKKTTFIHQVNQAHNQQVNNGAGENFNHPANERVLNHVDTASKTSSTGQNQQNKTMALSEDTGGIGAISPELIQTRHENSPVERTRKTTSHAEQAETGS